MSILIANTDADENPYDFAISGIGIAAPVVAPEIEIRGTGGAVIPDGDTTPSTSDGTNYGELDVNAAAVNRTFLVYNLGNTLLSLVRASSVVASSRNPKGV